jgi:hypothetical protein
MFSNPSVFLWQVQEEVKLTVCWCAVCKRSKGAYHSEHLAMYHKIYIDLGCNKEAAMSEFNNS